MYEKGLKERSQSRYIYSHPTLFIKNKMDPVSYISYLYFPVVTTAMFICMIYLILQRNETIIKNEHRLEVIHNQVDQILDICRTYVKEVKLLLETYKKSTEQKKKSTITRKWVPKKKSVDDHAFEDRTDPLEYKK